MSTALEYRSKAASPELTSPLSSTKSVQSARNAAVTVAERDRRCILTMLVKKLRIYR
jgi:hypothetical protein